MKVERFCHDLRTGGYEFIMADVERFCRLKKLDDPPSSSTGKRVSSSTRITKITKTSCSFLDRLILRGSGGGGGAVLKLEPPSISTLCDKG